MYGLKKVLVKADGNCLYHSLSVCIKGDDSLHKYIRGYLCDYGEKNSEILSAFNTEDVKYDKSYYDHMRKDGVWGDAIMVTLAARCFKYPIAVYVDGKPHIYSCDEKIYSGKDVSKHPNDFMILDFVNGCHYEPIIYGFEENGEFKMLLHKAREL